MMIRRNRFNIYLLLAVAAALGGGCQTAKSKRDKQASTLDVHVETRPDRTGHSTVVQVLRDHPIAINVEKSPILTEAWVKEAKVVDVMDGFVLRIEFDDHGTMVLEACTAENRGRRFAVRAQFGENLQETRWLAAPVISHRIADGVLVFTPDATREEAEQFVLGLNNVAKKVQSD